MKFINMFFMSLSFLLFSSHTLHAHQAEEVKVVYDINQTLCEIQTYGLTNDGMYIIEKCISLKNELESYYGIKIDINQLLNEIEVYCRTKYSYEEKHFKIIKNSFYKQEWKQGHMKDVDQLKVPSTLFMGVNYALLGLFIKNTGFINEGEKLFLHGISLCNPKFI